MCLCNDWLTGMYCTLTDSEMTPIDSNPQEAPEQIFSNGETRWIVM